MHWTPAASDRFYRLLVQTGLFLRWLFRIRLMVTGQENLPDGKDGAVVAITHFGYLDFAAAELVLWAHNRGRLRFLIHQGAADHWLAGPFISASGQVVVRHGSGTAAYDDAVARLRAGEYLAVMPEAGVSRSFKVRECKTGAVRMAAEAGVPLIPVSVWGAHRILTRGNGLPLYRVRRAPRSACTSASLYIFPRIWTLSRNLRGSAGRSRLESTPPSPASPWQRSRATGGCRPTWAAVPSPRPNAKGSMPTIWRRAAVVLPEHQRPRSQIPQVE